MKKKQVSGEITAFLSLIFVLRVSFILTLTQSASIQTSKNQKRLNADRAVYSLFGEYQKELLETYGVFAIDGTYQSGAYEERRLLDRMAYYGNSGTEQEVTDIQLLTDNQGQAFLEQVLQFMEEKGGIALIRDLTGIAAEWETRETEGQEMSESLDGMLTQGEELLPEEADGLLEAKSGGILALVLPEEFRLSAKSIEPGSQVSNRTRNTGRGSFPARAGTEGIEAKLLFGQYITDSFGSAVDQREGTRNLDYEQEYILCGKASDEENLRTVVNRLLLFRFAMNAVYLHSSAARQEEAAAAALTISVLVLHPEAEEIIRQMLLILWGFGESIMDLRSLLGGKHVPVTKDDTSWQLQLSALFSLGTENDAQEGRDAQNGLDYGEYLQILFFLNGNAELAMRTLDRIEQNLIQECGLSYFRADSCVTKLRVQNTADIWNGMTYTFPVYFGYL